MKVTLTQDIINELWTNARRETQEASASWARAWNNQNIVGKLKVGDVVTFTGTPDADEMPRLTVTYEPPPPESHLPPHPFAYYRYESLSGGPNHEVVVSENGDTSCNCQAGKFKRECWAQRQAVSQHKTQNRMNATLNPRKGFGEIRDAN